MTETQRYKIVERIAAGGMAEVYRGESAGIEGFRKKVAIKRVLPKLSQNREFIHMFLDEARLCAYLSHSKCVQVFDIGQAAGAHFIVMEYVDGADLQGVLEHLQRQAERMPVEVACLIAMHVGEGLAYAHDARDHNEEPLGIVHRDISPHNVLMTRFGEVKLVDFGLAKASSHLTADEEDIVKGKFGYLAPEVTLGLGADRRVDIFAAGILLWEMLSGRRLFKGDTDVETFKQAQAAAVPDIRQLRPEVGEDIAYVLGRALARDREQRYQQAGDFVKDLAAVLNRLGKPVTYQDLAKLVVAAAGERTKRRRVDQRDAAGMVGDLILDALHDFSSGENDAGPRSLGARSVEKPLASGEFVNPSEWGLDALFDDSPGPAPTVRSAGPPMAPAAAAPPSTFTAPKPPPPASPAAQRARPPTPSAPTEGGPFWRRWFGS
ncbi:MAG: Serine/threonine protein kinase PrkC, regulator of stationary phase [Polyangiaceae bacterium]|jgi:serine/threonine-protein kinase|nr:Serine/threonine protein kinase PrkC, regulator of stationary phase [Polyangiaceae bacterium]